MQYNFLHVNFSSVLIIIRLWSWLSSDCNQYHHYHYYLQFVYHTMASRSPTLDSVQSLLDQTVVGHWKAPAGSLCHGTDIYIRRLAMLSGISMCLKIMYLVCRQPSSYFDNKHLFFQQVPGPWKGSCFFHNKPYQLVHSTSLIGATNVILLEQEFLNHCQCGSQYVVATEHKD